MKAFVIDRYGNQEQGRIGEMPDPELGENDVLVQVYAAGVNPVDFRIKNGEFKLVVPYRFPLILGNDVAGVVVQVGRRVGRFKIGDEIYARPPEDRIGAFAELIALNEDAVAIVPKRITMEEAASIPLAGLTAWQALVETANLKTGQKVLIHAGSGGVGAFAIQLAKHLGATVATTTSTANLDLVKSLGADIAIDYKTTDFAKVLRDYDVVLNSLGAETLNKSLEVLKPGGKLVISGATSGDAPPAELTRVFFLQLSVIGSTMGTRDELARLLTFCEQTGARPVIDRTMPLVAAADGFAAMIAGDLFGKVVFTL